MKNLVRALTILIMNSHMALASINDELVALRFENMKTAMNARDFDIAMYRLRQIDVLERACKRETTKGKIPFSCFELRDTKIKANGSAKHLIFKVQSLASLNEQCVTAATTAFEKFPQDDALLEKGSRLSPECRALFSKRVAIETYKRTGRRIE